MKAPGPTLMASWCERSAAKDFRIHLKIEFSDNRSSPTTHRSAEPLLHVLYHISASCKPQNWLFVPKITTLPQLHYNMTKVSYLISGPNVESHSHSVQRDSDLVFTRSRSLARKNSDDPLSVLAVSLSGCLSTRTESLSSEAISPMWVTCGSPIGSPTTEVSIAWRTGRLMNQK